MLLLLMFLETWQFGDNDERIKKWHLTLIVLVYNIIIIFPAILIYKIVKKIKIGNIRFLLGAVLIGVYLFYTIRWINK